MNGHTPIRNADRRQSSLVALVRTAHAVGRSSSTVNARGGCAFEPVREHDLSSCAPSVRTGGAGTPSGSTWHEAREIAGTRPQEAVSKTA